MKRLDSKEVRKAVQDYLTSNNEMTLQEIKNQFVSEYGHMIHRIGEFNACVEWLRGLPISVDFYYCDIARLIAFWIDDTEEHQMSLIDKKGDMLYWNMLAREIVNYK